MLICLTSFETHILTLAIDMLQYSLHSLGVFPSPRMHTFEQPQNYSNCSQLQCSLYQLTHSCWICASTDPKTPSWFLLPHCFRLSVFLLITSHLVMSHLFSCFWTPTLSLVRSSLEKNSVEKACVSTSSLPENIGQVNMNTRKIRTRSYSAHILFSGLDCLIFSSEWLEWSQNHLPAQLMCGLLLSPWNLKMLSNYRVTGISTCLQAFQKETGSLASQQHNSSSHRSIGLSIFPPCSSPF